MLAAIWQEPLLDLQRESRAENPCFYRTRVPPRQGWPVNVTRPSCRAAKDALQKQSSSRKPRRVDPMPKPRPPQRLDRHTERP